MSRRRFQVAPVRRPRRVRNRTAISVTGRTYSEMRRIADRDGVSLAALIDQLVAARIP